MEPRVEFKLPIGKLRRFANGHNIQVSKRDAEGAGAEAVEVVFASKGDRSAFARAIKNGRGARLSHAKGVRIEREGQPVLGGALSLKQMLNGTKNAFTKNDTLNALATSVAPALVQQGIQAAATALAARTGNPALGNTVGRVAGRAAAKASSKALKKELARAPKTAAGVNAAANAAAEAAAQAAADAVDDAGDGDLGAYDDPEGDMYDGDVEGSGLRRVARQMRGSGFGKSLMKAVAKPIAKAVVQEGVRAAGDKMGLDGKLTRDLGNALGNVAGSEADRRLQGSGFGIDFGRYPRISHGAMRGGAAAAIRVGSDDEAPAQRGRPQLGMGGRRTNSYLDFDPRPKALQRAHVMGGSYAGGSFKPVGGSFYPIG